MNVWRLPKGPTHDSEIQPMNPRRKRPERLILSEEILNSVPEEPIYHLAGQLESNPEDQLSKVPGDDCALPENVSFLSNSFQYSPHQQHTTPVALSGLLPTFNYPTESQINLLPNGFPVLPLQSAQSDTPQTQSFSDQNHMLQSIPGNFQFNNVPLFTPSWANSRGMGENSTPGILTGLLFSGNERSSNMLPLPSGSLTAIQRTEAEAEPGPRLEPDLGAPYLMNSLHTGHSPVRDWSMSIPNRISVFEKKASRSPRLKRGRGRPRRSETNKGLKQRIQRIPQSPQIRSERHVRRRKSKALSDDLSVTSHGEIEKPIEQEVDKIGYTTGVEGDGGIHSDYQNSPKDYMSLLLLGNNLPKSVGTRPEDPSMSMKAMNTIMTENLDDDLPFDKTVVAIFKNKRGFMRQPKGYQIRDLDDYRSIQEIERNAVTAYERSLLDHESEEEYGHENLLELEDELSICGVCPTILPNKFESKLDDRLVTEVKLNLANPLWFQILRIKSKNSGNFSLDTIPSISKAPTNSADIEFSLVSAIIDSMKPGSESNALTTGKLMAIMNVYKGNQDLVKSLLLLILLRISVSCYEAHHELKLCYSKILKFLCDVLSSSKSHFDTFFTRHSFSDSRWYTHGLKAAWKAHLTPVQTLHCDRPPSFTPMMLNVWNELKKNPHLATQDRDYWKSFNPLMQEAHEFLTTHDMAIDIFTDLAKLLPSHEGRQHEITSGRWPKIFDKQIVNSGLTWRNIRLLVTLGAFYPTILEKMASKYVLAKPCYQYVLWALNAIVEEYYLGADKKSIPIPSLVDCVRLIGHILDRADIDKFLFGNENQMTPDNEFIDFALEEDHVFVLLRYVLVGPKLAEAAIYGKLYDQVWWLLHKMKYSFPYLSETLINLAQDKNVNIHMSGNAAMHIAACFICSQQPRLTVQDRVEILESLFMFSLTANSASAKQHISNLIVEFAIANG